VTGDPVAYPILQPVLLASRKSCNGEGNWYPQAGNHTYRFALTTHDGGWRNGRKEGVAANHPLQTVVGVPPAADAALPPQMSLASVSAANVMISTLKKCEDDDSVIARVYDIEGKDSQVVIRLFRKTVSAEKTNLIEEDGRPLTVANGTVALSIGHNAIETVKLNVK
jgi:alpha-mannosidase